MSHPIADVSAHAPGSPLNDLTPRQRVEALLANLPTAGGQLSQAAPPEEAALVEPLQRINEVMRNYGVEFELADVGNRTITRIVDRNSGELIRQIPSEEVLAIAERLEEVRGRLISLQV